MDLFSLTNNASSIKVQHKPLKLNLLNLILALAASSNGPGVSSFVQWGSESLLRDLLANGG